MPELGYVGIVAIWLLTSAAQGDGLPGAVKDVGGVGVFLGGLALVLRALGPILRRPAIERGEPEGGGELLFRARSIDNALMAFAAEAKAQTALLEELVTSARETAEYQKEGREYMRRQP